MQTITTDIDSRGVLTLSLDRPEVLNAFDELMIEEISAVFRSVTGQDVRTVVLSAKGKLFCSGADLAWMQRQSQGNADDGLEDARQFAEMLRLIHECPCPVVVRVHGHAFGGGVGLMAAADVVIGVPQAMFAISEARFGILPSVIGPYITHALGARQARRLALTAERFSASEAYRLGLVHYLVEADEIDSQLEQVLRNILTNGPDALTEIKRLFTELHGAPIDSGVRELSARTIARVRQTPQAQEGFSAFFEKRKPSWASDDTGA